MFSHVLVTYDGSELSKKSLQVVTEFAQANPSLRVDVIHVSNLPYVVVGEGVFMPTASQTIDYLDKSEALVEEAKQLVSSIPHVTVVQKQGPVEKTIMEYVEQCKCDLIIIGSRGHSALGQVVLGSVSSYVVQHSKVPVLIVK